MTEIFHWEIAIKMGTLRLHKQTTLNSKALHTPLAEIITIGDEILYGQIVDTNSQWISAELDAIGIKTLRKTSIGDTAEAIEDAVNNAVAKCQLIFVTGGLGPTKDDVTKKTLAKLTGDDLVIHEHALAFIQEFFIKRGRELTELNRKQAEIPSRATYLHNARGTAPGMWIPYKNAVIISMPGVPSEMKWLMSNAVLPKIKQEYQTEVILHKMVRTVGIGESFLADKIEAWEDNLPHHIKLAYLPGRMQVKLRLTGTGTNLDQIEKDIEQQIEALQKIIPQYIYSTENLDLEEKIGNDLIQKNASISTAESCTGGYLAHLITSVSGSSAYYKGSVLAYANEIKITALGVKENTLIKHGAVSEETVAEMARGVQEKYKTTYSLATSGIAGPGGGTDLKPVGTLWIACAGPKGIKTSKHVMPLDRKANIEYASVAALDLLRKCILEEDNGKN